MNWVTDSAMMYSDKVWSSPHWMVYVPSLAGDLVRKVSLASQVSAPEHFRRQQVHYFISALFYKSGLSESGWLNSEAFPMISVASPS